MTQKYKVRSLGFGDLLDLTVESLQSRERIICLAERCDVSSEGERFVMKINPGKSLEITPELVHDKLGIPRGCGDNNSCLLGGKLTAKEKTNEYRKLCNEMKEAGFVVDFSIKPMNKDGKKEKPRKERETRIKLDIFIQYMKGIRDVDKQVKCFLCILTNRLLLPTTSEYITGENIAFCSDLERVEKQDWCKIVFQCLKDGISEWMRKKGKENASDAVPTGCTAVLLISYLDCLLLEPEQEKPRIKHYNKEKLVKMLAEANEKDKMEKRKKDKKEKGKQKMYDNPKHKHSEIEQHEQDSTEDDDAEIEDRKKKGKRKNAKKMKITQNKGGNMSVGHEKESITTVLKRNGDAEIEGGGKKGEENEDNAEHGL